MPEELVAPGSAFYKPVAPAGLATEITAGETLPAEATAAFGRWLKEKLGADPGVRDQTARHSGLLTADLSRLLDGQGGYSLNRNQVQSIASALVEMRVISHADEAWEAAGLGSSDYLVPPMQVVQAMSRG